MNSFLLRWRAWLWWLVPLAALALLLAVETDWGRAMHPMPPPAPVIEPKPVPAALLPEYRVEGGLAAHSETVSRTLFNPTRRPAPTLASDNARRQMPRGQFVLTGTAVAGERHIAFLREVAGGKSRVVRQGEQFNGIMVATVTADRVKLTMGGESEELVLKVAPGPKTTTQPVPPTAAAAAAAAAPQGGPTPVLPGAVPAVARGNTNVPPAQGRRRIFPAPGQANNVAPGAQAPVPAAPAPAAPATNPTPAAAAPGTSQSTPASPDANWNEVYERMRQRAPPPTK